ncbi:NADH-quinone oxidoreductase subunit N [Desulfobotulus sp. H1]|uniref:NADH-quinone oxidoreductase subunit N n=1 Tax=Desulfobotulus pelophilus TaxID=2823377 RepID=A0ABT3N776_9BACT|nr:NADH-quinone oxidoreductase subunit N [Desulfobotulus pelophilus]MCW7753304.1 NADH-quinone oxidoreductase subunit N [Desulfobotulus pelophilus]
MSMMEFLPELVLIGMTLIFFGLSLFKADSVLVGRVALGGAGILVLTAFAALSSEGMLFFDAYRVDLFSQTFKLLIAFGFLGVLALASGFPGVRNEISAEYAMFLSISTMGLTFLVSGVELLTILLCLEISSFALYVAIPMRKGAHRTQYEAGIKYVLFGALATGVTVFGMSYVVGLTGTTYLSELGPLLPDLVASEPLALIGLLMILSGFFYKLALFPMHFWTPDVYEGAANETTAFVATLPKIGAVALLIRFMASSGADSGHLVWVLSVFAVFSMTYGNLAALVQSDIKRLLAFSSIAHAGYVMVGILSAGPEGFGSAVYYIFGYLVMTLGCFYVICQVAPAGENLSFDGLKGLHRKSPVLAFTLAVAACGMAGIPPAVGFPTKFLVFTAAIGQGYYALVILAVINAAISAFYYLKLVRAAYALPEEELSSGAVHPRFALGVPMTALGIFITAVILASGLFPEPIVAMAREAVGVLL